MTMNNFSQMLYMAERVAGHKHIGWPGLDEMINNVVLFI